MRPMGSARGVSSGGDSPGAPTALVTTGSGLRAQRIGAAAKGPRRRGGARGAGRAAASGAAPLPISSSQQHRCSPALLLARPLPTRPAAPTPPLPHLPTLLQGLSPVRTSDFSLLPWSRTPARCAALASVHPSISTPSFCGAPTTRGAWQKSYARRCHKTGQSSTRTLY